MSKHTFRFLVANVCFLAMTVAAYLKGWVALMVAGDPTLLSLGILALAALGVAWCGWRLHVVVKSPHHAWPVYENYIVPIRRYADKLVVLGLAGTVVGFIIAFSGVTAGVAGDTDAVGQMLAQVITGMSVALYTTLAGVIGYLWVFICYQILEHAAWECSGS
jgi:hypothetical protein